MQNAYMAQGMATNSHGWIVPQIVPSLARGKTVEDIPVVGCTPEELILRKDYELQFCEEDNHVQAAYDECSEVVKAAYRARISAFDLEKDERNHQLFREYNASESHLLLRLDVRNHIIRMWYRDVKRRLNICEALSGVPQEYHGLGVATFTYLELTGRINIGAIPIATPLARHIASIMNPRRRIAVVGGGISGLTAARQLRSFGLSVRLLESSNRFGGRIHTDTETFEKPVDVGAMLIIGTLQHPLAVLAEQVDAELHVIEAASKDCPLYDLDGTRVSKEDDARASYEFNAILDDTNIFRRQNAGTQKINKFSLGEAFCMFQQRRQQARITKRERIRAVGGKKDKEDFFDEGLFNRLLYWHVANLEYGCAGDINSLSLVSWDEDDPHLLRGDHVLLKSGYQPLVDGMAEGLTRNVKMGSPVTSIVVQNWFYPDQQEYRSTVEIGFEDGSEIDEFDAVVVTVSLGVLKKNKIRFDPPLPPKKRMAIEKLGWGGLVKVALKFEVPFWRREEMWGILRETADTRGEFYMMWNLEPCTGENVLIGMVAEPSASLFEYEDDKFIQEYAMTVLRRQYPLAPDPVAVHVTRWARDPNIGGAYTCMSVGSSADDYSTIAAPYENIFFSGEHTCREYPTTSAAAFVSGLRAAHEVIQSLKLEGHIAAFHTQMLQHGVKEFRRLDVIKNQEGVMPMDSSPNSVLATSVVS